ncbi:MAG: ATP-binding cassette domain-containing protein [Pseudomonadota bacterium]|nr:ATP-binding cassette domain-containing protein [Pseudomonadota bacterium]MBU1569762.1 ATP-binding cassette domain-containing protein [Pseudomonadota bacterium]
MLKIRDLNVSIQSVRILRGVDLELPTGSVAGLIGRNGAGKTTLMRSIMGLLPSGSGLVEFNGISLIKIPPYARSRLGIGYMPEERCLIPELTVKENILLPAWAIGAKDADQRLKNICRMIPEIEVFAERRALQLSGGQQKLVALGRALMCGKKLLLLDEPFEGVAPALSLRLVEVVGELIKEGLSVILSESNLQHSADMLDRVFRIDRGVIVESGN